MIDYIVRVYNDIEGEPRYDDFTVRADSEIDAKVIAFCLDGGTHPHISPNALVALAEEWTKVLGSGPETTGNNDISESKLSDLLEMAYTWRSAEIHRAAIVLGERRGDMKETEISEDNATTQLRIAVDRLHREGVE